MEYVKVNFGGNFISELLRELYNREIQSVIVEGGTHLLNQFIANKAWDEARIITSEKLFTKGVIAPYLEGQEFNRIDTGGDQIVFLKPLKS